MNNIQGMIDTIDNLLNCEFEPEFQIVSLTDMPVGDESEHFRICRGKNYVDFGILDGELCAYIWDCPGEGRVFLKALEEQARIRNLRLTIPTVLNKKLEKILIDNGYAMNEVPYMDGLCELWSKDG